MECRVTIKGLPGFQLCLPGIETNLQAPSAIPCRRGQPCQPARLAGNCLLPAAVQPVLEAFSPVISHEPVQLVLARGGETTEVEESGQRAAFRLLLAAMRNSGCPFFSRALSAGDRLPTGDDGYRMFRRMVRALTFPWRGEQSPGLLTELALMRCGQDIESHLHPVLREARRCCRQDAAINAVILMFSCARLAVEESREARSCRPTAA